MSIPLIQNMPTASYESANSRRLEEAGGRLMPGADTPLNADDKELKKAFKDFVGQTFFGQLLSSLRSTEGEAAYFNGGRAEEIFRGQLDQVLTEKISDASADKIADPMYELFQLPRS